MPTNLQNFYGPNDSKNYTNLQAELFLSTDNDEHSKCESWFENNSDTLTKSALDEQNHRNIANAFGIGEQYSKFEKEAEPLNIMQKYALLLTLRAIVMSSGDNTIPANLGGLVVEGNHRIITLANLLTGSEFVPATGELVPGSFVSYDWIINGLASKYVTTEEDMKKNCTDESPQSRIEKILVQAKSSTVNESQFFNEIIDVDLLTGKSNLQNNIEPSKIEELLQAHSKACADNPKSMSTPPLTTVLSTHLNNLLQMLSRNNQKKGDKISYSREKAGEETVQHPLTPPFGADVFEWDELGIAAIDPNADNLDALANRMAITPCGTKRMNDTDKRVPMYYLNYDNCGFGTEDSASKNSTNKKERPKKKSKKKQDTDSKKQAAATVKDTPLSIMDANGILIAVAVYPPLYLASINKSMSDLKQDMNLQKVVVNNLKTVIQLICNSTELHKLAQKINREVIRKHNGLGNEATTITNESLFHHSNAHITATLSMVMMVNACLSRGLANTDHFTLLIDMLRTTHNNLNGYTQKDVVFQLGKYN